MSFSNIDSSTTAIIKQKLDSLQKSLAAGYQGLSNAGRTGVSALSRDHIDPIIKSITLEDKDFLITKDIPTVKAQQSVYSYKVKTAVTQGVDLAGFEAFLPQSSTASYIRVAEVLKVYGVRQGITQMMEFINDAGGYDVDMEKENDENSALAMAEQMERHLYVGGDQFMNQYGQVDALIASNANIPLRQVRGIQANIREGDQSQRGIPGDFIGFGNNRSVIFDNKGGVLNRKKLDEIVTAVKDSRGAVAEAHCTTSQCAEFRATFFPIERADINSLYAIQGPNINNDEQSGFSIPTVNGSIKFIPTVFKYNVLVPQARHGSSGEMPNTPTITTGTGSTVIDSGSGFQEGQTFRYRVQAVNIAGVSHGSPSVAYTILAGNDNKPIEVFIANVNKAEYYMVFRTPVEADGRPGTEFYIGNVFNQGGGSTKFVDNDRMKPGLDGILFMPKDKNRAKLAILGNLLNKIQLGSQGLASETVYASYFGCIVERPRSFAILDAVFQKREGL